MTDQIRKKIRSIRASLGYSQEYMAAQLGVDIRTYGSWERGPKGKGAKVRKGEISVENLQKIANVLGVDVLEIWDFKRRALPDNFKPVHNPTPPIVEEPTDEYGILRKEIEQLKEVNLALTRSLNKLLDNAQL